MLKKILTEVLVPGFVLAAGAALVAVPYWLVLVYFLSLQVSYAKVLGVVLLVEMTANKLSHTFRG